MLIPVQHMTAYPAHTINYSTHLLITQTPQQQTKKKKKKELHKRAYLSENGGYGETWSGEWTTNQKRSDRTRHKRGDLDKWDQTDSPDIHEPAVRRFDSPLRPTFLLIAGPPFGSPFS